MIYEYAFDSATISPYCNEAYKSKSLPSIHLLEEGRGLLLTCRQLYRETTGYVGAYKHLIWNKDLNFHRILLVLSEEKATKILSIVVPGSWASWPSLGLSSASSAIGLCSRSSSHLSSLIFVERLTQTMLKYTLSKGKCKHMAGWM